MKLSDPNNPLYFAITGLLVVVATFGSLWCYYEQWSDVKDFGTIATVAATYAVTAASRLAWIRVKKDQAGKVDD